MGIFADQVDLLLAAAGQEPAPEPRFELISTWKLGTAFWAWGLFQTLQEAEETGQTLLPDADAQERAALAGASPPPDRYWNVLVHDLEADLFVPVRLDGQLVASPHPLTREQLGLV